MMLMIMIKIRVRVRIRMKPDDEDTGAKGVHTESDHEGECREESRSDGR